MKVHYLLDGMEQEGDAKNFSTLGAFIQTDSPVRHGPVDLTLEIKDHTISLPGQVVDVSDRGFSVAFGVMDFSTLERLASTLGSDQPKTNKPFLAPVESQESHDDLIDIQGPRWSPPVTEPVVHEWRPDSELITPVSNETKEQGIQSLPTLSPMPGQAPMSAYKADDQTAQTNETSAAGPDNDPADKRQSTRHEMSIPVTFDNLTGLIKEFTHNISYGGMFVYTTEPIQENAEIAITLVHPIHGQRLTLLAKVVHASDAPNADPVNGQPRYGLGIEFRLPLDELKRVLSDFIESHQHQSAMVSVSEILDEARSRLGLAGQSPYDLLGLDDGSDQHRIRQAYFKLVDRFHPDRYFGKITGKDRKILEELFRSLTKAYEELTS